MRSRNWAGPRGAVYCNEDGLRIHRLGRDFPDGSVYKREDHRRMYETRDLLVPWWGSV
jgi:hypothetical protein